MQITLKPKFRRNLVKRWVLLHFRDSQSLKLPKNRFLKKIFPMKSQWIKMIVYFAKMYRECFLLQIFECNSMKNSHHSILSYSGGTNDFTHGIQRPKCIFLSISNSYLTRFSTRLRKNFAEEANAGNGKQYWEGI